MVHLKGLFLVEINNQYSVTIMGHMHVNALLQIN